MQKKIKIGNNVWIGANVVIFPGVTISDNVTIGDGSMVKKDIGSNKVAVGNPCNEIRSIQNIKQKIIARLINKNKKGIIQAMKLRF